MNLTKTFGLAFLASALLLSACKKDDDDDDTPANVTCKLDKSVYFDGNGAREDSALFTYTGDKITRAVTTDYYYTYEYSGDRVSRRNFFETGETTPAYFQRITYNADGTPNKIETLIPTTGTNAELYDQMNFIYSSGKLQKIDYLEYDGTTSEKTAEFTYTYTGNNITSATITDLSTTPSQSLTLNYTYDTNPNALLKQNASIYYLDPFFGDADPSLLPLTFSQNNAVSLGAQGQTPAPLTYTLDDRQNLKDIKVASRFIVAYSYKCQ
jgi:hypothetical protein